MVRHCFLDYLTYATSTKEEKIMAKVLREIFRKYGKLALVVPLTLAVAACS